MPSGSRRCNHTHRMEVNPPPSPGFSHPVTDVLREREEQDSRPGERRDPYRVALAVEGGGMRGVVSAGMAAALERLA